MRKLYFCWKLNFMRIYFWVVVALLFFTSCDDGDIIVTTLAFEDEELDLCESEEVKVLYRVSNDDVFETISLKVVASLLSRQEGLISTDSVATRTFPLDNNNEVIYRTYNGEVPSDYFCREIPPSDPEVLEEFKSVGGTVVITTIVAANETDHDRDQIPSAEEGFAMEQDSDNDQIPDYLDIDDDGDNVPTSIEQAFVGDPTDAEYPDFDEDEIPDYLDTDDDGDGILTKYEVSEGNLRPNSPANQNAAELYHYLNPLMVEKYEGELQYLPNKITRRYLSAVVINELQLQNQNGDSGDISFESYEFGTYTSSGFEVTLVPDIPGEEPEESDE